MHDVVAFAAIAWLGVLLAACIVLLARGRTSTERALVLDLLVLILVGVLAVAAGEDGRSYALDAALALALLSFVSTVTTTAYLRTRRPFGEG